MTLEPEEEHGEGRSVDDTQTVGLASLEGEGSVVVEGNLSGRVGKVRAVLGEVDEGLVGDGLGAGGIVLGHEDILIELSHGVVVPVAKNDGVLVVVNVGERLVLGMDDEGSAKTVGVLVSVVGVPPVRAGLLGGKRGIREYGQPQSGDMSLPRRRKRPPHF